MFPSKRIIELQRNDYLDRQNACQNELDIKQFYISQFTLGNKHFLLVVRDDKLCGGTKSRIIDRYIKRHNTYTEYVYPTSWYGGAQVAIAWGAKRENKKAVFFTPILPEYFQPAFIKIAEKMGAQYYFSDNYQQAAKLYVQDNPINRKLVENGLGTEESIEDLTSIGEQFKLQYGRFDELWVAVGSGTLIKSLQRADLADRYYGVCVFHQCPGDLHNITEKFPVEQFSEPARYLPPFPSASHYDAKVLHLLQKKVRKSPKRILYWNVM